MSSIPIVAPPRPWYREAMVWFVIAFPALAVVGGIATTILAVRSNDGLVAGDYYKRGLAINQQVNRQQRAADLGLRADLQLAGIGAGDVVRLALGSRGDAPPLATVTVRLVHPGKRGADRVAHLGRTGVGLNGEQLFAGQWADATELNAAIAWRVEIEAADWRLDGDLPPLRASAPRRLQIDAGN